VNKWKHQEKNKGEKRPRGPIVGRKKNFQKSELKKAQENPREKGPGIINKNTNDERKKLLGQRKTSKNGPPD